MINISHPRVHGKPPVKKYQPKRPDEATILKETDPEGRTTREKNDVDNNAFVAERDKCTDRVEGSKVSDYNQNIIETTTCSFEQLCTMINDLEKNISSDIPEIDKIQLEPERDISGTKRDPGGTYDDIMSFLGKLEDGSLLDAKRNVAELDSTLLEDIFDVRSPFNLELFGQNEPRLQQAFKEDLATARLEIEEKDATIRLLKDQLKAERKSACEKLETQKKAASSKLQAQEEKYKGIVKRHQKFIEQLLAEKKDLTEKCNSLANRVKEVELKMQRDTKVAGERHMVELQRAKEHYAAAEKIRRERWIEARTLKIKEMTVKGLEPELRHMMEQNEEEIQRLRNAHMKELQDAELRIVRRSNQQLDQLRLELNASHEKMLANEKNILWGRYRDKLEEQETLFKTQQAKLLEELQEQRVEVERERAKREAEKDEILQQTHVKYQQEIEALKEQHLSKTKTLQDSLKAEWEAWLADFKRQQVAKFERAENKIRDECDRERDRQIELAIERLERESRETRTSLQQNFDNKLRSLKDKYEMDLQAALDSENLHKDKLLRTKDKLERTEIQLQKIEKKLQEYVSNLNSANELIGRLTMERDNAKRYARQEIEAEKRELEEKIGSLYKEITRNNASRDASMAQLHSRIKLIMTQKMLTIRNLTKELTDVKSKGEHLEKLLDQQRKEYILKSL